MEEKKKKKEKRQLNHRLVNRRAWVQSQPRYGILSSILII
jgi:hypothetical protein